MTSAEARLRLDRYGPNAVSATAVPRWRMLAAKFWGPIPWMLETAAVFQLWLGEDIEAAVIGLLLLLNAGLGWRQEGRAAAALAALKQRLALTAQVSRDGKWVRLAAAELVPGDVVRLPLGALVPADGRLLSGSIAVDQSMLTGESVPVDAAPGSEVYAGALVRRGEAVAEVTATGARTYFGRTAELVRVAHAVSTEHAAVFAATRNLAAVNGVVALFLVGYAALAGMAGSVLVSLALTALLASIPVALPATFTLSAALAAQVLAGRGVLLTRLSAAHEAAAMDVLCADKTGTLTRNTLTVEDVRPMPGFARHEVLTLAALASSEADRDPIDAAIRSAAADAVPGAPAASRLRFVPFDPATKMSEAEVAAPQGARLRIVKGAFVAVAAVAAMPREARDITDELAARGHRVIAVAVGPAAAVRLAGLVALSDPPRTDSAEFVAALSEMGVRTAMITGDSAVTASSVARQIGIPDAVCPPERLADPLSGDVFSVFARVVPERKFDIVRGLQARGHTVGMCGDGANDAPALRQAQIGIAVSSATDAAKAAAGLVLTEAGLGGIVCAVREGRTAFQRLLTYTINMLVKKVEIVVLLVLGLVVTGQPVMTPILIVLMMLTNDFLSMSLTTDRAHPAPSPSRWDMGKITAAGIVLGVAKLGFSTLVLALARYRAGLVGGALQTLTFVTLVFGNQALLFVARERGRMWASRPSRWVIASSLADIGIASGLALAGLLMPPLPFPLLGFIALAAVGFALVLDQLKRPLLRVIRLGC